MQFSHDRQPPYAPVLAPVLALGMTGLLLACHIVDRFFARTEQHPGWFLRLRALLMVGGSSLMLVASYQN